MADHLAQAELRVQKAELAGVAAREEAAKKRTLAAKARAKAEQAKIEAEKARAAAEEEKARADAARQAALDEARKKRWAVAIGAGMLLVVLVAGFGYSSLQASRDEQARELEAKVHGILADVYRLKGEGKWNAAHEAWKRADYLVESGDPAKAHLREVRAGIEQARREAAAGAEADKKRTEFVLQLDEIRLSRSDEPDGPKRDRAYEDAFRAFGLAIDGDPEAAAKAVRELGVHADAVVAALDDWLCARRWEVDGGNWKGLLEVLRAVDKDAQRQRVRFAVEDPTNLPRVATELIESKRLGPRTAVFLGTALIAAGRANQASRMFMDVWLLNARDPWVNHGFAVALARGKPPRRSLAVRYLKAAQVGRPRSQALRGGDPGDGERDHRPGRRPRCARLPREPPCVVRVRAEKQHDHRHRAAHLLREGEGDAGPAGSCRREGMEGGADGLPRCHGVRRRGSGQGRQRRRDRGDAHTQGSTARVRPVRCQGPRGPRSGARELEGDLRAAQTASAAT